MRQKSGNICVFRTEYKEYKVFGTEYKEYNQKCTSAISTEKILPGKRPSKKSVRSGRDLRVSGIFSTITLK